MSVHVASQVTAAYPLSSLLVIEGSTTAGSVALFSGGALVTVCSVPMGAGREDHLFPAVQRLLAEARVSVHPLAGVVCGAGPGSFTSLRIAASLAKGIAHGASLPLFAVPSLLLAAADASEPLPAGPVVVHADALRGERYVLDVTVGVHGEVSAASSLRRMSMEHLDIHAAGLPRLAVLGSPSPSGEYRVVTPSAAHLGRVALSAWAEAVPLDQWEPQYGRLAEAQVKWEASHGALLPVDGDA
jgi:tRNA threonylcarbamoyladenosine biosynthesis protein TsaB